MNWKHIVDYFENELWRQSNADVASTWKKIRVSILKVLALCVRGYMDKGINTLANSLSYALVFAVVPILAIILAVAQGFGVQGVIEDYLNSTFLGDYHVVPTIMEMVRRYLETAQGGVFLGVGLLILIWAVYSFFQNVESAFNGIWNVSASRSISRQLITYLAILFLLPVLMVVSSGMFSTLAEIMGNGVFSLAELHIQQILPYITAWVLFTAMYKAVPNTQVKFLAALIPGILMGTLFQLLQWALVHFVVILARTSVVYGAFAIIPIFLMCVQWMCLMILIGAQLSFAIQNNEMFDYENDIRHISHRYSRFLSLYIVRLIVDRFCADETPLSAGDIATEYRIPIRLVRDQLKTLTSAGIIREVYVEDKEHRTYQPAMDVALLTVGYIQSRLDKLGHEQFLQRVPDSLTTQWEHYCNLQTESAIALPIRDL